MKTVRFLFAQVHDYRKLLILSIGMAILQVPTDILSAFPLKFILDKVIDNREPSAPWSAVIGLFDALATRAGLGTGETHTLLAIIAFSTAMIVVLGVVGSVLTHTQLYVAALIGHSVSAALRVRLFEHMLRLSLDWHGEARSGDLVQRLTGNVADLEKLIIDGLVDLLAGFLTLLGMVAVMLAFNWQFTLLSIFVVPTLFLVVWTYTRRIKAATKKAARAGGQLADVATEDVRAITEVKAFTLEDRETQHFKTYVDKYRDAGLRAIGLEAQFRPLVALVLLLSTFTIVGVGSLVATGHTFRLAFLVIPAGTLTIGTLTVFLAYIRQLYQPMRDVSKLMYIATNAAAGAERIQEVLDQPAEVIDAPTIFWPTTGVKGAITYDRVVFGYVPSRPVIKGVRLHVEAGQRLALVGLSGSGKTTLVKLIPRFYQPWRGELRIDDIDNSRYPLALLRRNVGFVLQESVLFEGTIRDNIAIGRPEATDRQIVAAARQAQIHRTIMGLPGRYEARVREQGKNLSSGQRQRLAIARAMLRDAPILILDEPTANLDVEAEAEVMRALDNLLGNRTVIMISHRLSTLGHVDEIAVLHKGVLVERGDLPTLKDRGGMFSRLLEEQTRYSYDGTRKRPGDNRRHSRPPSVVRKPRGARDR